MNRTHFTPEEGEKFLNTPERCKPAEDALLRKLDALGKPNGDGFTYKLTLEQSSKDQWQVTIHEYYAPLSDRTFSVNYSATFNNLTNGGSHQELFPILKSAGEFLLGKIDQYYQQHGDASNATAQLNAEDVSEPETPDATPPEDPQ